MNATPQAENTPPPRWQPVHAAPGAPANPLVVTPPVRVRPHPVESRARIVYRVARHIVRSVRSRDFDFVAQGLETAVRLAALVCLDLAGRVRHECNVCGWRGGGFYPHTGPGYHDRAVICPGCGCLDRHRSLLALLLNETRIFDGPQRVIEVAPMRGFEAMMRSQPDMDYVSFDLERHAMEHGDITAMSYDTGSVDNFLCFHVLEHIPDDGAAVKEIHRVLRPGGTAVLQVPLDWHVERTREYDAPDPREVGHVRRYGRDFSDRLAQVGLEVRHLSVLDVLPLDTVTWFGLSTEPIFFAMKPDSG
jgi:SAM-dependent methyltransferase